MVIESQLRKSSRDKYQRLLSDNYLDEYRDTILECIMSINLSVDMSYVHYCITISVCFFYPVIFSSGNGCLLLTTLFVVIISAIFLYQSSVISRRNISRSELNILLISVNRKIFSLHRNNRTIYSFSY